VLFVKGMSVGERISRLRNNLAGAKDVATIERGTPGIA